MGTAADITRGIAEDHNRIKPEEPINFYSAVRVFSHFLAQADVANPWSGGCEVVLAGFLSNGSPALAKVLTDKRERAQTRVFAPKHAGSLVMMAGGRSARDRVVAAMARAFAEPDPHWVQRAMSSIVYLCDHEGESTIGGAPSVAVCARGGPLFWPFVVVGGKTYLRGFDVSASAPPCAPVAGDTRIHLAYDQGWHSAAEQDAIQPEVRLDQGLVSVAHYIDEWVDPKELFEWKVEPASLLPPPDMRHAPDVIVVGLPDEMEGLP